MFNEESDVNIVGDIFEIAAGIIQNLQFDFHLAAMSFLEGPIFNNHFISQILVHMQTLAFFITIFKLSFLLLL